MATKHDVLAVLCLHVGAENSISGNALAKKVGINARRLRHLTDELIDDGIGLCSHPSRGYYIAQTDKEIEHTCEFHRSRAMHELRKVSRLQKIPLPDLIGQLHLPT